MLLRPRRVQLRKVLRVVLLVLLSVVAICGIWLKTVEIRSWGRMEQRLREIDGQIVAMNGRRPVLRGAPQPGDAWEDYGRAAELLKGFKPLDRGTLGRCVERDPKADRAAARRLLEERSEALAWMRRGTCREDARRTGLHLGEEMASQLSMSSNRNSGLYSLCAIADCKAFLSAEDGLAMQAAEHWLDLAQFANDLWREGAFEPELLGSMGWRSASRGLYGLLSSSEFSEEELCRIDRELALLDGSYARPSVSLLGGLENWGQVIVSGRLFEYYSMAPAKIRQEGYGWLIPLFSSRLALAASFLQQDAWVRRLQEGDQGSSAEDRRLWSEVLGESASSWNLVNRFQPVLITQYGSFRREGCAALRLLRVAAHYRATGAVLDLPDPFGARLLYREEAGILRVWSLGVDGLDDGGVGEFWNRSRTGDMVVEVRR